MMDKMEKEMEKIRLSKENFALQLPKTRTPIRDKHQRPPAKTQKQVYHQEQSN